MTKRSPWWLRTALSGLMLSTRSVPSIELPSTYFLVVDEDQPLGRNVRVDHHLQLQFRQHIPNRLRLLAWGVAGGVAGGAAGGVVPDDAGVRSGGLA